MRADADVQVVPVVAIAFDRVIGVRGQLPWKLPDDLRRFKATTLGHPVVMGRKTYASLGKPLVGRANIVVTRQPDFAAPEGVQVVHDPRAGFALAARADPRVFVIGGATIYEAALPQAEEILATFVYRAYDGDAFFPRLDASWHVAEREDHAAGDLPFSFVRLVRRAGADACAFCRARAPRAPESGASAWELGLARVLADLAAPPKR